MLRSSDCRGREDQQTLAHFFERPGARGVLGNFRPEKLKLLQQCKSGLIKQRVTKPQDVPVIGKGETKKLSVMENHVQPGCKGLFSLVSRALAERERGERSLSWTP